MTSWFLLTCLDQKVKLYLNRVEHVCCMQAEVDVRRVVHLYHDLQRNVGIKQIYCSYMRALHRQGEHLRHLSSGRKTFQGTKTLFLQERADDSHTTERNCHLDWLLWSPQRFFLQNVSKLFQTLSYRAQHSKSWTHRYRVGIRVNRSLLIQFKIHKPGRQRIGQRCEIIVRLGGQKQNSILKGKVLEHSFKRTRWSGTEVKGNTFFYTCGERRQRWKTSGRTIQSQLDRKTWMTPDFKTKEDVGKSRTKPVSNTKH